MYNLDYKCYLVDGSILKSQMKAEGLPASAFLEEGETEKEYNKEMLRSGFAEINEEAGTVSIFSDGPATAEAIRLLD